ncbi:3-phosphoshikimate 1-carboxyvinyltransferase [Alicyclobacillus cycloheptanicus]|uniref:3-phosphoshikimate 1-carboxyvinyltransferase n=1 Tax=Alicyclobacillus cycloheptanicus TaxID=1457 RepID=A0ABT9XE22_9BACL|nr:3-phosphoshikimate 1-carboxyvinyltransferase [Alicyclobacillus cycloheptanicus]MDQ0188541.1 3-phosphoshikimate 1-carboxyvinyltransferase [Alicyclobacillus cycloheptanicus]WDM01226.1 3-phosphoshikimate 1-carboxyvinyltransferase [Alicyclobacillus cycloheptanicus]
MSDATPDLQARSPWSTLTGVQRMHVDPYRGSVTGELSVPGSKSFTNRALIIAAMARGQSRLSGILQSDDSYWCIDALQRLGIAVHVDGDCVEIEGCGGAWPTLAGSLYLGASGTLSRFLPGALAAAPQGRWTLDGSSRLRERPMRPLLDGLTRLGAQLSFEGQPGALPFTVHANGLDGGEVFISGDTSSQFISGLLIAAPYARTPVTIHVTSPIVQHAYVRMTLDLMAQFGVDVEYTEDLRKLRVEPAAYQARELSLEADASTACYFLALAAVTGGRVCVQNLPPTTRQPDIGLVDVLARMGCTVERTTSSIALSGPPQTSASAPLKGGFTVSMKEMSDQAVLLAAIAVYADAPVTITDVAHIRAHESDRIAAICASLQRLGIQVEEHEDGLTVYPGRPGQAALPSYDDHRIAMSLSVLAAAGQGADILDPGCVSKTCPAFFDLLGQLGIHTQAHRS